MFAKNNTMKDLEKNANIEEIKENDKIISTSEFNQTLQKQSSESNKKEKVNIIKKIEFDDVYDTIQTLGEGAHGIVKKCRKKNS